MAGSIKAEADAELAFTVAESLLQKLGKHKSKDNPSVIHPFIFLDQIIIF